MAKRKITVDVISDVACPWCYIGKKRLETSMKEMQNDFDFELTFHPFQLDPSLPSEGIDRKTYFENKFGGEARVDEIFSRVERAGKSVGIDLNFKDIPMIANTLPLHILLEAARREGIQQEVTNMLFEAYMVKPKNLALPDTLVNLMEPFGWDEQKTLGILADKELAVAVKSQIKQSQQLGISGVPFFIVNNKYGISGAQPVEYFTSAFQSLKDEDFASETQEETGVCEIGGEC